MGKLIEYSDIAIFAVVLLCCVELCSLHLQYGGDPEQADMSREQLREKSMMLSMRSLKQDGIEKVLQGYTDFGVCQIDNKGAVKSDGA